MSQTSVLSCPLCLRAGDAEGMVNFDIPHHAFLKNQTGTICQSCCESIGAAIMELTRGDEPEKPGDQPAAVEPNSSAD